VTGKTRNSQKISVRMGHSAPDVRGFGPDSSPVASSSRRIKLLWGSFSPSGAKGPGVQQFRDMRVIQSGSPPRPLEGHIQQLDRCLAFETSIVAMGQPDAAHATMADS